MSHQAFFSAAAVVAVWSVAGSAPAQIVTPVSATTEAVSIAQVENAPPLIQSRFERLDAPGPFFNAIGSGNLQTGKGGADPISKVERALFADYLTSPNAGSVLSSYDFRARTLAGAGEIADGRTRTATSSFEHRMRYNADRGGTYAYRLTGTLDLDVAALLGDADWNLSLTIKLTTPERTVPGVVVETGSLTEGHYDFDMSGVFSGPVGNERILWSINGMLWSQARGDGGLADVSADLNLDLTTRIVPAPASAGAFGTALMLGSRRRRANANR